MMSTTSPIEIFTLAFVYGLSLESEIQLVSLSLQDSTQYSGRSQSSCSLDGLGSPYDFQLFYLNYQGFKGRSKCTSYNWYHRHLHVPEFC